MKKALTFDDVALVPKYNNVPSRTEPSLKTWFTKDLEMDVPIIPANMDTVVSQALADVMYKNGGRVIMHRFCSYEDKFNWCVKNPYPVMSCGVKKENLEEVVRLVGESRELRETPFGGICLDIAHGHSMVMIDAIKFLKDKLPDHRVIAGNVCTARAYHDLSNAGADAIKVGIGPGAACTTRIVTGFGVPQFTAIRDCAEVANELRVPLIADGGIRNSRDIVLALAAGASSVMIGKLFALTEESAAEKRGIFQDENGNETFEAGEAGFYGGMFTLQAKIFKLLRKEAKYRGQASADFQEDFYGGLKKGTVAEGEAFWAPVSGTVQELLDTLCGGIKSGFTYAGSRSIKELQRKAEFVEVTANYGSESNTRK